MEIAVVDTLRFNAKLNNQDVVVQYRVSKNFDTYCNFWVFGRYYEFWLNSRSMHDYITIYQKWSEHHKEYFHSWDGLNNMDTKIHIDIITHFIKNIFTCFEQIITHHTRELINYSVWYQRSHISDKPIGLFTYEEFITNLTCQIIEKIKFSLGTPYELVEFEIKKS